MWPVLKSFGEERICHSENDSRSEINKVYLQFYTEQCKEGEEGADTRSVGKVISLSEQGSSFETP